MMTPVSPAITNKNLSTHDYQQLQQQQPTKVTTHTSSDKKPKSTHNKTPVRSRDDVFARLTQGLPTRHTAPPSYGKPKQKRSQSTGKLHMKNKNGRGGSRSGDDIPKDFSPSLFMSTTNTITPTTSTTTRSSSPSFRKSRLNNHETYFMDNNNTNQKDRSKSPLRSRSPGRIHETHYLHQSHSILRNPSASAGSGSTSTSSLNQVNSDSNHKVSKPRTLASQLLLPSPPRDFISGIPEPPSNPSSTNQNLERSFNIQNIRDIINSGSKYIFILFIYLF